MATTPAGGDDGEEGRRLMVGVAADVDGEQDRLIDAVLHRLELATPALFASTALEHALRAGSAANIRRVHQLLLAPRTPDAPAALPPEARDLTTTCIRHGVALVELLEAWRVGQAFVSDWWRHRIEERAREQASLIAAVDLVQTRISTFADAATAEIRTHYDQERRAWEGTLPSRRARLVRDILADQHHEPQRASAVLNYPLNGWHTAAVLWRVAGPDGRFVPLDDSVAELASRLGDAPTLTVPISGRTAWVWTTAVEDAAWTTGLPAGTSLALGSRRRGTAGFRRSHTEALDAQRVALQGPRADRPLVRYVDVEIAALMSRQPADMWCFVRRTLGPLAAAGSTAETLRGTLATYLESGCSVATTARALHTHRNTVGYRLARITELLGEDFARRTMELAVALELVDAFGLLPTDEETAPARPQVVGAERP